MYDSQYFNFECNCWYIMCHQTQNVGRIKLQLIEATCKGYFSKGKFCKSETENKYKYNVSYLITSEKKSL